LVKQLSSTISSQFLSDSACHLDVILYILAFHISNEDLMPVKGARLTA